MLSNPNPNSATAAKSGGAKTKKTTTTRGQIAIQAAATSNAEIGEATTANNRKMRDTMAAKNGRVAETILREQTLETEFMAAGGTVTDGVNAQSRLKKLRIPVDAAGRSPSSLAAAASSSPLAEEDRFSFHRGPPQTPTRTPSHLSTVVQPPDSGRNTADPPATPAAPPALQAVASRTRLQSASTNSQQQAPADVGIAVQAAPPPPQAVPSRTRLPSASTNNHQQAPVDVGIPPRPPNIGRSATPPTGQANAQFPQVPPCSQPPMANPTVAPAPLLLTAPATPVQHGPSATSAQTFQDPWAQPGMVLDQQTRNGPVRVEVRRYEDFGNPLAPISIQYVTVPLVSQREGVFSCKLSDVLGPLGAAESPLKACTSRIYRVGPLAELVTLGNGSEVTDPGSTQLVNNPFINTHNVERTEWNGVELFTGVQIFYEQRPTALQRREPAAARPPVEDQPEHHPTVQQEPRPRPRPRANHSSTKAGSSTSGKKRSHRQRSPSTSNESNPALSDSQPFDPEKDLFPFLRRILRLDPDPGQWQVKTAREALNRHLTVADGVEVAERLGWKIPATEIATMGGASADDEETSGEEILIPQAIRGMSITKQHLQHVFGFTGGTTWWTLGNRWSKKELKGAKTVFAWVKDPDDTVVNEETGEEEERFPHLNKVLFNKLKSVITLDKAGRYTRHGPIDESDESEEVDCWDRDWDWRPQGSRSGDQRARRRGSSSRRGTSDLDSEGLDDDRRRGERSGKVRRAGR